VRLSSANIVFLLKCGTIYSIPTQDVGIRLQHLFICAICLAVTYGVGILPYPPPNPVKCVETISDIVLNLGMYHLRYIPFFCNIRTSITKFKSINFPTEY